MSDFGCDETDNYQRRGKSDAEHHDGAQPEHDLALRERVEQDRKCSRVGKQPSGNAQPYQDQQTGAIRRCKFQIVGMLEAPAMAVMSRFFVVGVNRLCTSSIAVIGLVMMMNMVVNMSTTVRVSVLMIMIMGMNSKAHCDTA